MNIKNKKIVVVGLGRSGVAIAKFLNDKGADVMIVDNNENSTTIYHAKSLMKIGINFKIGKHSISDFSKAQMVIISPGVHHNIPVLEATRKLGIPVMGEIEIAANFINKPIIGVTGTNGKTTTVKLIEKMLTYSSKKVFLCGNIGTPLTESLSKLESTDIIVVEISSFQLDTIMNFKPTTAVLLNITEDHMNRYPNITHYSNSKLKIFLNQSENNMAIFNAIDQSTKELVISRNLRARLKSFSYEPIENGAQIFRNSIKIYYDKFPLYQLDLTKSSLQGSHNRENIAAASLAALSEGGNVTGIQLAIDNFKEPEHCIETVKYFKGIKFVNDSKATNMYATISALNCLDCPIILIIGGQSKNNNFEPLRIHLLQKKIKRIIVIGETNNKIKSILSCQKNSYKCSNIITTITLKDAVKKALVIAKPGYTILLSPACASLDQFESYKHRGLEFKRIVEEITDEV